MLSHGHDDHHAALSYLLPKLGNAPLYASRLTAGFIMNRFKDFRIQKKVNIINENDRLQLGPFTIDPIHVTHSVPDSFHFAIHTPAGIIYHGSDFKFDLTPIDDRPPNFKKIVAIGNQGVRCLLSDCLGSERPGFTPSEKNVFTGIHREMNSCTGRLIFTTMSSNIHRIQQAINVAVNCGRKVIFLGRSLERNVDIASRLGFLKLPRKNIINKKQFKQIPDSQLCVLIAGSQGQESSSLTRYASGEHRFLKPKPTDKVIFSADIIPGNEQLVYQVIDELAYRQITVAYSEIIDDLHVSGHASAGEMKLLIELTKPQYLYPFGGNYRHMYRYQQLAVDIGYRPNQVLLPVLGQIVEFDSQGQANLGEVLKIKPVYINPK